jgi:glycosyltransferase involved in cell wall biosynthesis
VPLISAVTTCKGRLEHLQLTLPTLMALPDCEVVVVDYDCPQRAGDWVRATFPAAIVVHVPDRPHFKVAEARNRGVAAATAPWLLLIDADVAVAPTFVQAISPVLRHGVFLRPTPCPVELSGTFVVAGSDVARIGGYDEVFEGWGGEDVDMFQRLERAGLKEGAFPGQLLSFVPHDDEARGRYHAIGNPRANVVVNNLYRLVKDDMSALGVDLPEDSRRSIYGQIKQGYLSPGNRISLECTFDRSLFGAALKTTLRYRFPS